MELNNNNAAVCADSINAQAGTSRASEIDLYDELVAFAELSPEDQLRLVDTPERATAETEKAFAEDAEAHPFPEPALTPAPNEPVAAETSPAAIAVEQRSSEPLLTPAPNEPVEAETAAADIVCDSEFSKAYAEPAEVRPLPVAGPRPSGPLSGFNLPPNIVYTGALSQGVCVACDAESAADDLFCITCGAFIDEIASTLPVNPTCGECKQGIAADEIFCPWCGSVL